MKLDIVLEYSTMVNLLLPCNSRDRKKLKHSSLRSSEAEWNFIDFGIKSEYKELVWAGINYKINNTLSSFAALFGYSINDRFNIGYSYGIPSSSNSQYYSGSHEFLIGVKLPN